MYWRSPAFIIPSSRATLEAEARKLGMMKAGERQYIVSGLPGN